MDQLHAYINSIYGLYIESHALDSDMNYVCHAP